MENIKSDEVKFCALCGNAHSPIAGFFHQEDHSHPVCFSCFTRLLKQGVPAEARVEEDGLHLFHRPILREAF